MQAIITFSILVSVMKVQELVPYSEYVKPVFTSLILGLLGQFMLGQPPSPHQRFWRPPLVFWGLFSLGVLASIPIGLYPSQSAEFFIFKYLSTSILIVLVARNLTNLGSLERSSQALVLGIFLLGVKIIVDPKILEATEDGPARKTVGYTYDPNDLAMVAGMCVPFIMYWFQNGGLIRRLLAATAGALSLYTIYATGSRGGLICLGVTYVYLLFSKEIGMLMRLFLVAGLIAGGAAITQTRTFTALIQGVQGSDYNASADDGRLKIWIRGLGYAVSYPITGVGLKCFEVAEGKLSGHTAKVQKKRWAAAHNSFIEILAETGFPTFFCWVAMLYTSLVELRRQRNLLQPWKDDDEVRRLLHFNSMVRCSFWAYFVGGFFISEGYCTFLYLLVAYTVVLGNLADELEAILSSDEPGDDEGADNETGMALLNQNHPSLPLLPM